ncbi:zinc metallopeptidase [Sphingomonas naphthae]|uniref:Zinc metallopeptidase n=1 Tax=Sphingomonas naphthae TaxID=1813468 RepID=A0ABY7TMB0_9SPHN|nr:neutral zinc metallopeptidase [Sphingomonas naphthae]WCT74314.1 zinc metallopeptidase [Sphingomonas naphthae]
MRLDDYRTSDNVGEAGRGGGGGMGGGGLGLLFLIGSKFGIGGIIVVVIGMFIFGMNPLSLIGGGSQVGTSPQEQTTPAGAKQICDASPARKHSCQVLASTEDTWAKIFQANGQTYQPPRLNFYSETGASGCGQAQSAMGPFYCPSDQGVYLDTSFFDELSNRFKAAGDFAQNYVIAHEVGHHVQYLTGIAEGVRRDQQRVGEAQGNQLQVRMELQADCFAGVWAAKNRDRIEPGDIEEGMRAANAIGDDTLQKSAGRAVVPESFTHGTSAQRMAWLKRGLDSGDPAQCDTFKATTL